MVAGLLDFESINCRSILLLVILYLHSILVNNYTSQYNNGEDGIRTRVTSAYIQSST